MPIPFRTFTLQMHLALLRFGWSKSIASAICIIGLAAWFGGLPYLRTQQNMLSHTLQKAQQSWQSGESIVPQERRTAAEDHFRQFMDGLGDDRYTEQQIKTLFGLADRAGLILSQAEYKLSTEKNGRYRTYQILLPVKGQYGAIRQFCEQTLLTIPFASLDEMSFKRDAIGNGSLEARLRFTVYLAEQTSGKLPLKKDPS